MKTEKVLVTSLALLFLGLSPLTADLLAVRAEQGQAPPPAARPDAGPLLKAWEAKGWGTDRDQAVEDALGKAQQDVAAYLAAHDRPSGWVPPARWIAEELQDGEPTRLQAEDQTVDLGDEPKTFLCYEIPLRMTRADYDRLLVLREEARQGQLRTERQERSVERIVALARGTAFVLAALVLFLGYLRIDELTKGYLSRWLGIGILLLWLAIGLGLLVF